MVGEDIKERKKPGDYDVKSLGYNYRMSNLNAAIGCAQLEKIGKILNAKRRLFKK